MQKRYFIQLSYCGSRYHGWQTQPNATSVQATIEQALSVLLRQPTPIVGCGRTDTGVHAKHYVAHVDIDMQALSFSPSQLLYKCNAILPYDIVLHSIDEQAPQAHARFDAQWRSYEYHLSFEKQVFKQGLVYQCPYPNLDMALMNKAAERLLQHEDFECFAKVGSDTKHYRCKLIRARWEVDSSGVWVFHIRANRFLRNMVRAIVGTLIEVGRGRLNLDDVEHILLSGKRSLAGWSVPAQGLFLTDVRY